MVKMMSISFSLVEPQTTRGLLIEKKGSHTNKQKVERGYHHYNEFGISMEDKPNKALNAKQYIAKLYMHACLLQNIVILCNNLFMHIISN